jgi:circadian clock protein KaiC
MTKRLSTGIAGLNDVLRGGLRPGRVYLVRGAAGSGKTTLAMQFLMAGARQGEAGLFVSLNEPERALRETAALHNFDLTGVHILDVHLALRDEGFTADSQYTIFHPADVELAPVTRQIIDAMDREKPVRVIFDSLTEVGSLTRDALRYRRQVLVLRDFLVERGATTLFLTGVEHRQDDEITSLVHGIIVLGHTQGRDGRARRSLRIDKYRDSDFAGGEHALETTKSGLVVYPHLLALEHGREFGRDVLPSGIEGLDRMLGGGLDRGTVTLLTGSSGVGKTTVGLSFLAAAARRGERGIAYTFEEDQGEIIHRCEALGLPIRTDIERGLLHIEKVNPLVLYPDQFAAKVRDEIERRQAWLVMIDSINGYRQTMPDEEYLVGHMHQLAGYLNRMGIVTVLTNELATLTGQAELSRFGLSHLVDTIVLMKYYEFGASLRTAIGVVKRRLGEHDRGLRALEITPRGVRIGDPLPQFRGILRGEASWADEGGTDRPDSQEGSPDG